MSAFVQKTYRKYQKSTLQSAVILHGIEILSCTTPSYMYCTKAFHQQFPNLLCIFPSTELLCVSGLLLRIACIKDSNRYFVRLTARWKSTSLVERVDLCGSRIWKSVNLARTQMECVPTLQTHVPPIYQSVYSKKNCKDCAAEFVCTKYTIMCLLQCVTC